jgi:CRISPR-associated protein Cmr2
VSRVFWQAKIWGILHDLTLKALHDNTGGSGNTFWQELSVMQDWVTNGWNPEVSSGKLFKQIKLADYIASASDRGAIGSITSNVNYNNNGLAIAHLLSGAKLNFQVTEHDTLISNRLAYLTEKEQELPNLIPESIRGDEKSVFWWLWRCLPEAVFRQFANDNLMLMPAETRLPDSSIWSHASITAALAGSLTGYDATTDESGQEVSHPYLVSFTFTPVQELIKASRKMRDLWAGSWILHYIAAKICFKLALQYGPDSLLYPSLFQQPLIDHWLLEKFPSFDKWVKRPKTKDLLTAGFPNVIVVILPKDKVEAAMQTAEQTLKEAWQELGNLVFEELHDKRHWMKDLQRDSKSWQGWLKSQWQFYWAGVPLGKEGEEFSNDSILEKEQDIFTTWVEDQNQSFNSNLFQLKEFNFLRQAYQQNLEKPEFSVNVGSWWSSIFDQTRTGLAAVKNARSWQIPTAFAPRSTISGIGPVVHPGNDWVTEGETKKYWERHAGLFDGREQLNATETVKRGLEKVLPKLLKLDELEENISASYPDLTGGVAGYLKVNSQEHLEYYNQVCKQVRSQLLKTEKVIPEVNEKWGIPWIDENEEYYQYHPRLLNAGWLVEDLETREVLDIQKEIKSLQKNIEAESGTIRQQYQYELELLNDELNSCRKTYRQTVQQVLNKYYPSNNPADWYVLAAGDGDGMSEWLKGKKMRPYGEYVPQAVLKDAEDNATFAEFLTLPKQMGPSTHSALSRALLDFSNNLVPYLTEQRYAGRSIYAGGDDVMAYTNLWEWDKWLWDIRQCFRGDKDPKGEFKNDGDYWQYDGDSSEVISKRPLFTMGRNATISFGVVIAHHSVPLAIALDNMWLAEKQAKSQIFSDGQTKDAVTVRVLYGNGNIIQATAKFAVFELWQGLIDVPGIEASIFEQAANLWNQHPVPVLNAIQPWTQAFCDRREQLKGDDSYKQRFQEYLSKFLFKLWQTTPQTELTIEVQNWLKIAAFVKRNREIKLGVKHDLLV